MNKIQDTAYVDPVVAAVSIAPVPRVEHEQAQDGRTVIAEDSQVVVTDSGQMDGPVDGAAILAVERVQVP